MLGRTGVEFNFKNKHDVTPPYSWKLGFTFDHLFKKLVLFSKSSVQTVLNAGKICILDIDCQGVQQLKAAGDLDPQYLFIKPPSLDVLEQRLRDRGTETEESIGRRLSAVQREMDYGN